MNFGEVGSRLILSGKEYSDNRSYKRSLRDLSGTRLSIQLRGSSYTLCKHVTMES
ncbi:hypothetical protein CPL00345_CDS0073 [Klebsiella phage GlastoCabaret]